MHQDRSGCSLTWISDRIPLIQAGAGTQEGSRHIADVIHHALRQACGTARVKHVGVVFSARNDGLGGRVGEGGLVVQCTGYCRGTVSDSRAVADLDHQTQLGKSPGSLLDSLSETCVIDEYLCVGVIEQLHEFVGAVTVVDVDRYRPRLEGAEIGFEVFRAVVEQHADFCIGAGTVCGDEPGELGGTQLVVSPGNRAGSLDHRGRIGYG